MPDVSPPEQDELVYESAGLPKTINWWGAFVIGLAGTILLGSIPGVWLGAGLAMRLPVGVMRATLAVVLLAAGLALMEKANVGIAPTVVIGVPVVVAAVAWLLNSFRGRTSAVPVKA